MGASLQSVGHRLLSRIQVRLIVPFSFSRVIVKIDEWFPAVLEDLEGAVSSIAYEKGKFVHGLPAFISLPSYMRSPHDSFYHWCFLLAFPFIFAPIKERKQVIWKATIIVCSLSYIKARVGGSVTYANSPPLDLLMPPVSWLGILYIKCLECSSHPQDAGRWLGCWEPHRGACRAITSMTSNDWNTIGLKMKKSAPSLYLTEQGRRKRHQAAWGYSSLLFVKKVYVVVKPPYPQPIIYELPLYGWILKPWIFPTQSNWLTSWTKWTKIAI